MNEKYSSYRWVVLATFMLVAMMSQLLWLTFAPLSTEAKEIFGVSAFQISLLSIVWPIVFVITAIPVGIFIDKKGFKKSVALGAVIMAIFSILRIFSTYPDYNFLVLLVAQTGCALSQAFIFGSITKMAVSWFPQNEQGIADGLATIGLFLGMMLALVITPWLYTTYGMKGTLAVYAAMASIIALLFLLLARENDIEAEMREKASFSLTDLWNLSRLRSFFILEYGFFAGVGGFTAIMTWLEEMLHAMHGLSINEAGMAGGSMMIGGIVGSIIIPAVSDRTGRTKPFVIVNLLIGAVMLPLLGAVGNFAMIALVAFITGFFLMSALPLVLALSSTIAGKGMEGRASSMLWFYSQVGSIILIALIEPLKELGGSYRYSLLFISLMWIIALVMFLGIKEKSGSD